MRVNVYAEEHAGIERGWKETEGGRRMAWLRVKLKAHPSMVPPEHRNDDSPAVTFWFDNLSDTYTFCKQILNSFHQYCPGDPL